ACEALPVIRPHTVERLLDALIAREVAVDPLARAAVLVGFHDVEPDDIVETLEIAAESAPDEPRAPRDDDHGFSFRGTRVPVHGSPPSAEQKSERRNAASRLRPARPRAELVARLRPSCFHERCCPRSRSLARCRYPLKRGRHVERTP